MKVLTGMLPKPANYKRGRTTAIRYIVIHYTANKGDTALNNINYFANNAVKSSAHYFVDENFAYSSVPVSDTAYHCGGGKQSNTGGKWHKKCTNANSIGIEMCLLNKSGNVKTHTITNTIELTKYLMDKYNVPCENVIRHWDVVGKYCPGPMTGDNNVLWNNFKKAIEEDIDMEKLEQLTELVEALRADIRDLKNPMIYNYIDDNMPVFAKPTIQKLCDKGILKGDSKGLNLDYTMLRLLVILDRAGVFDK